VKKKVVNDPNTTTDYCGNVIYENGIPKTLLTDAGFVSLSDSKYHYYLQDHQDNNRVVADQNGNVEEVNHYYPFGGTFASTASVQDYKYNGKELDRKGGLDWYDYGARRYDAALGRWHAADPMAEKYYGWSPYNYCVNNPIKYIDPNGQTIVIWYKNEAGRDLSFSYSGGNVTHSNPFVQAVITAYQYNKANGAKAGNGGGVSTVAIVENTDIKVNVREATLRNAYSFMIDSNEVENVNFWFIGDVDTDIPITDCLHIVFGDDSHRLFVIERLLIVLWLW